MEEKKYAEIKASREHIVILDSLMFPTNYFRIGVFEGNTPFTKKVKEKLFELKFRKIKSGCWVSEPLDPMAVTEGGFADIVAQTHRLMLEHDLMRLEPLEIKLE